jgi:hypothetical protein
VKKFLLTEKLPMETTIDESMISVNPFHWIKKTDDTVIAGTINGNKSFVIAEKLVQKPCFRKLCKWLIQPVAPDHDTKIGRQNSEVFCTNSSGSFNNHFCLGKIWS